MLYSPSRPGNHVSLVLERSHEASDERRAPRHGLTFRLPDGRLLGYDDVGDPDGVPLFVFHGGGDSRLTRHPDDTIAERLGIRLVAVDRCGAGLSDFRRGRRLLDWPEDVAALADALGIRRFGVLGYSAGGPHALACAYALSERVSRAAVVCGMPPPDRLDELPLHLQQGIRLARRSHRLAQPSLARWGRKPPRPTGDQECDEAYARARAESFRNGSRWLAWELGMLSRPWGFDPVAVRTAVDLWYGARDTLCPASIGRHLERLLPYASLRVLPDEGHQLLFPRWAEILTRFRPARLSPAA